MATITPTLTNRFPSRGTRDILAVYAGMANGDTGAWISEPGFVAVSMSVAGTLGALGAAAVAASLADGATSAGLTGAQGDEITVATTTALGVYAITVAGASFRPKVTAGDGTTALTVTILLRAGA